MGDISYYYGVKPSLLYREVIFIWRVPVGGSMVAIKSRYMLALFYSDFRYILSISCSHAFLWLPALAPHVQGGIGMHIPGLV